MSALLPVDEALAAILACVEPLPVERLDIDVDPALAGGRDPVAERADLGQPAADNEQRIGGLEALPDDGRAAVAGHAEVERVVVRDHVCSPPAGDHRDTQQLRELAFHFGARPQPLAQGAFLLGCALGRARLLEDRFMKRGPCSGLRCS